MEKKSKPRKPKITTRDLAKEISSRTGISASTVLQVIETFGEVAFQCLRNKIEVPFLKLGTIGYRIIEPRDYVEWLGFDRSDNKKPIVFYLENTDGYVKPVFRLSTAFRNKLKEETLVPHGTVPSGENVLYDSERDKDKPRINFIEYMLSLNDLRLGKEQRELISKQERDKLKEEQLLKEEPIDYEDEYDSIVLEEETE